MNHLIFTDTVLPAYPVCVLVPFINRDEIMRNYIQPSAFDASDVLVLDLHRNPEGKTNIKEMREYVTSELAPVLTDAKVKYLLVGDAEYFKALTGAKKVEVNLGYVLPCTLGPWHVIYVPNYSTVFYDPIKIRPKIQQGLDALAAHASGAYEAPGNSIIKFEEYPDTYAAIDAWLIKLIEMDVDLAIDIEGFDLKHHKCGIGSIAFAWNQHEGIAFAVDYKEAPRVEGDKSPFYGMQVTDKKLHHRLKAFFIEYMTKRKRRPKYHNISFDVYVLIYQLFMTDITDTESLLEGLGIMLENWDDTKLIAYLATNSCAGNKLGLKDQAQEFAGNYAETEIHDIRKIPKAKLLRYNLVDALSTWYVFNKHNAKVDLDDQREIYEGLFKDSIKDIVQMQLTGLPVNQKNVAKVKPVLVAVQNRALDIIEASPISQNFLAWINEQWVIKKNQEYKVKRVSIADANEQFNLDSAPQLQHVLYDLMQLPVIETTETGLPGTGAETLDKLKAHTKDPVKLEFLNALIDYKSVNKILSSFIPAIENATMGPDGWHYLFGNFNLGGTVSGRLSSSDPNLQNLPANVEMVVGAELLTLLEQYGFLHFVSKGKLSLGKLIKFCFSAPPGWMFCGLDFNSLEDRISALTTKDPNKIKVYTGVVIYELTIDGRSHHIRDDDTIEYDGKTYTGEQFYVLHTSGSL